MIAMTVARVISKSSNGLGKKLDLVWVTYHDGIYVMDLISLYKKVIRKKDPTKDTLGLS